MFLFSNIVSIAICLRTFGLLILYYFKKWSTIVNEFFEKHETSADFCIALSKLKPANSTSSPSLLINKDAGCKLYHSSTKVYLHTESCVSVKRKIHFLKICWVMQAFLLLQYVTGRIFIPFNGLGWALLEITISLHLWILAILLQTTTVTLSFASLKPDGPLSPLVTKKLS